MRARVRLLYMLVAMLLVLGISQTSCAREHGPAIHGRAAGPYLASGQPGTFQPGAAPPGQPAPAGPSQTGLATYYGNSLAGNKTASGEVYDPHAMTAAHRELPFGTMVEVLRRDTGARVVVRITDRGPFGNERRIIDLSRAAAEQLDMIRAGVVEVSVRVLR